MITFSVLALIILVVIGVALLIVTTLGAGFFIIFADLIVFGLLIWLIIRIIFGKKEE